MNDLKNETIEQKFQYPNRDTWIQAMQKEPNPKWFKERKIGDNKKSKYIPLPIQQALADKFFRECDVIKEEYQPVSNEILCTVTISILPDYPYSEHRTITGTAAKPIQQRQGSAASLYPEGKIMNALEYNAPAARSAAISNALTTFANIFGRNINRDVKPNFSFIKDKEDEPK